jgi:RNA polymerase sigma factor for flagellar operon FliA
MTAAWRAYGETLSEQENLKNHMPLVRSVVDRMRASLPPTVDADDLYSVGLLGLIQAVRRFDPTLGVTFASYATMRIRGAVLDELRRVDWMSRSLRVKAKKVTDVIASIEQKAGRPATEAEVAEELGISSEEYSALLDELRPLSYVELDAVAGEEDDSNMHDVRREAAHRQRSGDEKRTHQTRCGTPRKAPGNAEKNFGHVLFRKPPPR